MQAPHQGLAHPRHAQHSEAPAFQLVQDYSRRVVDIVFTAAKRPGWWATCERTQSQPHTKLGARPVRSSTEFARCFPDDGLMHIHSASWQTLHMRSIFPHKPNRGYT